jgi:uncharacterized protein (TIGR03067 family)
MRCAIPIVFVVGVALAGADRAADTPPEALKELQGKWVATEVEVEGAKVSLKVTAVFDGRDLTISFGKESGRWSVSTPAPPNRGPKPLDLTVAGGPNKGKVALCIYELKQGNEVELRLCGNLSGNFGARDRERPAEFKTAKGDESSIIVLKRVPADK